MYRKYLTTVNCKQSQLVLKVSKAAPSSKKQLENYRNI